MAVQNQIFVIGDGRTFTTTKPIATKQHMAVWVHDPLNPDPVAAWSQMDYTSFDLINNSAVINEDVDLSGYNLMEVRVADTPDEMTDTPSDIAIVVGIATEIVTVANISSEVVIVANLQDNILDITSEPLRQAILDVSTDPLKQAILDAQGNADRSEQKADESEASAVRSESAAVRSEAARDRSELIEGEVIAQGDIQNTRIIDQGNTQNARIIDQGDTQDARVISEGDTQEQRVIDSGDDTLLAAQQEVWNAEAEAKTSDSFANEYIDGGGTSAEWVKKYTSNGDGTFSSVGITNTFSSYYWSTKAGAGASGLTYQGIWDMGGGAYPTTRPPEGTGDTLEAGDFFIVTVGGTTPDSVVWEVGDWAIVGTALDWARYPNVVDWNAVVNVPENVSNALSRSGGDMTGNIVLDNLIQLQGREVGGTARQLIAIRADSTILIGETVNPMNVYGSVVTFLNAVPRTSVAQGTRDDELTRKDYVDAQVVDNGTFVGMMAPFNGAFAAIRPNWQLCDGTNGTPDMTDSFIKGTTTEAEVGTQGGSNNTGDTAVPAADHSHTATFAGTGLANHTHTTPAHTHPNWTTASTGAHTHTLHHNYAVFSSSGGSGMDTNSPNTNRATSSNGAHTHSITTPSGGASTSGGTSGGTPAGSVTVVNGGTGDGTHAHTIDPTHYKFAWIQRMS